MLHNCMEQQDKTTQDEVTASLIADTQDTSLDSDREFLEALSSTGARYKIKVSNKKANVKPTSRQDSEPGKLLLKAGPFRQC